MLPREDLLKGVEHRETLARAIDLAENALRTWEVSYTDFLSPPEVVEIQEVLGQLSEVHLLAAGGYPQAERQRMAIARCELPLDASMVPLTPLDISGNFLFDTATHRDFLGAILGTGIVREKVGDIIILGERGAQVIVVPEIAEFLELSLTQVRSVPVKTRQIDWKELKVRPPKKKEMTTVEPSMRLDAIASAGFGMSRNKMSDLIAAGDVRVNWKLVTTASHSISPGDLISVRSKGRVEVGDVSTTKKNRYRVQLTRYV
ncbi:photosystem II S4 domain protein [Geitlerinema sp. PCC 9228]|jgi:photosystem II S4 domain protein|uniref:photosystem II S4 domain protein n=1 Tax=Geitlerinema sp. PCC 9228 TaxID=111611 RepID=UPI0008F99507|nr:photosystem II S4 domain protein [Geitlerinema sp. PCC 9228]